MFHFINLTDGDSFAVGEILREADWVLPRDYTVEIRKTDTGCHSLTAEKIGDGRFLLSCTSRVSLLRGIGLIAQHGEEAQFSLSQTSQFDRLALMLDASRNAVPRVETVKKTARVAALMGFTAINLYLEDTYTVQEYPHFGYLRGRYTPEELQELDDYTQKLGLELSPCIQTLAHLKTIFKWKCFQSNHDLDDALLVGEEKTYELIDAMLKNLSSNIRSRYINIGMDEAGAVGRGKYLDAHGTEERRLIILKHLNRVNELCKKYGYHPMMWSDMFTKRGFDEHGNIPERFMKLIPPNVGMVAWIYWNHDAETYELSFRRHQTFPGNPIAFTGYAHGGYGLIPLSEYSKRSMVPALTAVQKFGIRDVSLAVWNDNGADCSLFATLPTWQGYAEFAWTGIFDFHSIADRMKICTGGEYRHWMSLEDCCNLPTRTGFGDTVINPNRYLLYQDPLMGLFDRHVPAGTDAHYAKYAKIYGRYAKQNPQFGYFLKPIADLCRVLAIKSELGVRMKQAYDAEDLQTLEQICNKDLPKLQKRIREYHASYRSQWMTENKPQGYEVQDIRIAGVLARAEETQRILREYLNGERNAIEPLAEARLFFDCRDDNSTESVVRCAVDWLVNVTAGLM